MDTQNVKKALVAGFETKMSPFEKALYLAVKARAKATDLTEIGQDNMARGRASYAKKLLAIELVESGDMTEDAIQELIQ